MKLIIWDFRNTIYNTDKKEFSKDALQLLTKFHGKYKQVLASAVSLDNFDERIKLIKDLGLDVFFDEIHIGKKNAEVFLSFSNKYKITPKDTYVIGDNAFSEITIGNRLGMKTIWIPNGKQGETEIKAWKRISKLKELENII